jgi:hypothetical protein
MNETSRGDDQQTSEADAPDWDSLCVDYRKLAQFIGQGTGTFSEGPSSRHRVRANEGSEMVSPAYYRSEADRCRKLAEESTDPQAADRWRRLARDYSALADELDARPAPPAVMHAPMQQQPVQQQQGKQEPDDEEST